MICSNVVKRWLKFNLVGAIGIVVQLAALAVLKSGMHVHYLLATGVSVEIAVLHNFVWHERFTWADRTATRSWTRLMKFNITTGLFSIVGNIAVMKLLVDVARLNYFVANIVTIASCSLVNFVVSDLLVFENRARERAT